MLGSVLPSEPPLTPLSLALGYARPDRFTWLPRAPRTTGMRHRSYLSVCPSVLTLDQGDFSLSPVSLGMASSLVWRHLGAQHHPDPPSFLCRVPVASTEHRGPKAMWWVSVGPPQEHPARISQRETGMLQGGGGRAWARAPTCPRGVHGLGASMGVQ